LKLINYEILYKNKNKKKKIEYKFILKKKKEKKMIYLIKKTKLFWIKQFLFSLPII